MPRRPLLLLVVDVVVALAVALLVFRLFGATAGNDSNPPVCSNTSGGVVSCDLTPQVLMLPTFVGVLLVLATWQLLRARRAHTRGTSDLSRPPSR